MARAAATPCRAPGCGKAARGGYCDKHKHMASNWKRDGNTTERGYGHRWRVIRERVLRRDEYTCQDGSTHPGVLKPATEVDHIVPKCNGGTDDEDNLRATCEDCHKAKTARESREARRSA